MPAFVSRAAIPLEGTNLESLFATTLPKAISTTTALICFMSVMRCQLVMRGDPKNHVPVEMRGLIGPYIGHDNDIRRPFSSVAGCLCCAARGPSPPSFCHVFVRPRCLNLFRVRRFHGLARVSSRSTQLALLQALYICLNERGSSLLKRKTRTLENAFSGVIMATGSRTLDDT